MDIESKDLLSDRLRAFAARSSADAAGAATREETERMMILTLQSLVERFEALEARVPTSDQLDFLTARMEDQRWQLETWRRLTKWGGRLMAALGAYGLVQSLGWKPWEVIKALFGDPR